MLQHNDKRGTMHYPALVGEWTIHSWDLAAKDTLQRFYELTTSGNSPEFVWLSDDKLNILSGKMKHALKMNMRKGGFVLSKRLKRYVRPFKWAGDFRDEHLKIVYHDESKKTWDGAGLMHRRMIKKVIDRSPLSKKQKAIALKKIGQVNRFELTMLSSRGQDKGHVFVVDDPNIEWDFYLPKDTKEELAFANPGTTFIGLWDVHSKQNGIWMDMQSLVNLGRYIIPQGKFDEWLDKEGQAVIQRVLNGDLDDLLSPMTDESDQNGWITKELIQAGGSVMWSASLAKAAMNAHIDRMAVRTFEKMRLPVPGQRLYIGVDKLVGKCVPKGHAEIDHDNATIWVSADDWVELSEVWGGADQDDGMWVLPFQYPNHQQRLLVWRSPNQPGEFAVLKPTEKISGEIPVIRKEDIPLRIDKRDIHSLGYVAEPEYEDGIYSTKAMWPAIRAASKNIGTLGMFCNVLMCAEALGLEFEAWPARLEDIVDGQVKTGVDMSAIKVWCKNWVRNNLPTTLPEILWPRVEKMFEEGTVLTDNPDHWLSNMYYMAIAHVERWIEWRDEALKLATPPLKAIEEGEKYKEAGSVARDLYYKALGHKPEDEDFIKAREALMTYLSSFDHPEDVALGMIAASHEKRNGSYMKDHPAWVQYPLKKGEREFGPAEYTMMGLRKIGVIGTVERIDRKLTLNVSEEPILNQSITINGVWFSHAQMVTGRDATRMAEFSKDERDTFKREIADKAVTGGFNSTILEIRDLDNRKIAVKDGLVFGYLAPGSNVTQDKITILHAVANDGNLVVIA
jgi:hypothetical protein